MSTHLVILLVPVSSDIDIYAFVWAFQSPETLVQIERARAESDMKENIAEE